MTKLSKNSDSFEAFGFYEKWFFCIYFVEKIPMIIDSKYFKLQISRNYSKKIIKIKKWTIVRKATYFFKNSSGT